ncbi:MAG: GHKL domain-containing protein [Bacteroidetes bacterium]|nr:GHKL domain-containing protein [Bacteroidota bacterium]
MAGIVSTIGQKCKRCFSCIRECPATAIRVVNGQAFVITERCISCGHCVKVCSQHAKEISSDIDKVLLNLIPTGKAVAMVAPSFAASFPDNYLKLPSALKSIGFSRVTEAAFGADLISPLYEELFEKLNGKTIISSPCPAIYNYIEKYYTELVPNIAPIVSPMIAMGRYLKETLGETTKVVFIGPCVAKKSEYTDDEVNDAVDAVLTFTELNKIFHDNEIDINSFNEVEFDAPLANLGKSFPLTGGLLKTANIPGDVLAKKVIVVDGKEKVEEIIQDISKNKIKSKFVDILFCEGCINGPAIESDLNYYSRREKVINYIDAKIHNVDKNVWKSELYNSRNLKLERNFSPKNQRRPMPSEEKIKEILARTNKILKKDELNCGACGYPTCRAYAVAIAKDLAEEDMCLPFLIDKIEKAYSELKNAQEQLHHAEKLASVGQLAAGVAHEINNPLGTIMMYSSILKNDLSKKSVDRQTKEDLNLIIEEANRCKSIVANLLDFARQSKLKITTLKPADIIYDVIKELKYKPAFEGVVLKIADNSNNKFIEGDKDQLKQVFLNLINNACEALEESKNKMVSININNGDNNLVIEICDNGCGIPEENIKKLFTPFFTTKKIGKGTGLGLAITYGIIKMHKGDIKAHSVLEEGTTFKITMPYKLNGSNILN